MTEPTDAEILELASQYWHCLDETESATEIELVRAALAKWGTPPAVAGEPYGYLFTAQEATIVSDERKSMREVFTRKKPPCASVALYTAPQPAQAQAGAITPPPIECNTEELKRAYTFGWWSALEKQRETAQAGAVGKAVHQFCKKHCADWYDGFADHSDGGGPYEERTLYTAEAVPRTCEWTHNDDDGFWETACGEAWRFDDGGPAENSMHFCHSCGKSLRIKGGQHGTK